MSMNALLRKSIRATSQALRNAISSVAYPDGPSLSNLPDGPKIGQSGQAVVPVSPSAPQAKVSELPMNATSGPNFCDLSWLADHQSSSENKSLPLQLSGDKLELTKRCRTCKQEKKYSEYYVNSKGNRPATCIECVLRAERIRKRSDPNLIAKRYKNWRDTRRGHALTNVVKHRAKNRGMEFNLTAEDIQRRIDNGTCELTGIPFDLTQPRAWNAPSLDRIDSKKGYTQNNVRVILYAVNVMANTWGSEKILTIAEAITQRRVKKSNDLSEKLGQALQRRLSRFGSTEYELTWKKHITPSGHLIYRLRASGRRTSGSDCTGWPSPTKGNADGSQIGKDASSTGRRPDGSKATVSLNQVVLTAGWPSPMAGTPAQNGNNEAGNNDSSRKTAALAAGWPTTRATDGSNGGPNQTGGMLSATVQTAGWPTPDAQLMNDGADPAKHQERLERLKTKHGNGNGAGLPLGQACHLTAGWLTPSANEDAAGTANGDMQNMLSHQAMLTGSEANGSTAATASSGASRLNPSFSRWLMGFPVVWDFCGATAMQLSRKSPRNLSKPISKRKQKLPNWLS
jgi:hypothetical protein